jgi:hypothetical protein
LKRIHRVCKKSVRDIKKREVFSKEKKCIFEKEEVGYLGFVVGKN